MSKYTFTGKTWIVGDFIPTDQIVKTHRVLESFDEMARYVLEDANPRFAVGVQQGDVLIAGKHFGQSSGRAVAVKALIATGISCIVAESFSRTFYRNAFEIGLPILEASGISARVKESQRVTVDLNAGHVTNLETSETITGEPTPEFLLSMLEAGGIISMAPILMGQK